MTRSFIIVRKYMIDVLLIGVRVIVIKWHKFKVWSYQGYCSLHFLDSRIHWYYCCNEDRQDSPWWTLFRWSRYKIWHSCQALDSFRLPSRYKKTLNVWQPGYLQEKDDKRVTGTSVFIEQLIHLVLLNIACDISNDIGHFISLVSPCFN